MEEDLKLVFGYLKEFWSGRRFIFLIVGIFFILGVVSSIFSSKQYLSSTSFITQVSSAEKVGSGLKNIAALIGVSFGDKSQTKDLPVYLYPKILSSLDYQRELLATPIYFKSQEAPITLKDYYLEVKKPDLFSLVKRYTIGLPGLITRQFKSKPGTLKRIDSLNYISEKEARVINKLQEAVQFSVDEADGSIMISAVMDENVAAAQLAERAKDILQQKIIEYRINKAEQELEFIQEQYDSKKEDFQNSQSSLASYIDRNLFNTTQLSQVRKNRLELDYNLSYVVYSELETQKVRQEIKVQEDTPVFITLQPAIVPLEPMNEGLIMTVVKFIIVGFLISVLVFLTRMAFSKLRPIWKSS